MNAHLLMTNRSYIVVNFWLLMEAHSKLFKTCLIENCLNPILQEMGLFRYFLFFFCDKSFQKTIFF